MYYVYSLIQNCLIIYNLRVAKAELGEDEVRLAADIATLRFTTEDLKLESKQHLHGKKIHCVNFLRCSKKKVIHHKMIWPMWFLTRSLWWIVSKAFQNQNCHGQYFQGLGKEESPPEKYQNRWCLLDTFFEVNRHWNIESSHK